MNMNKLPRNSTIKPQSEKLCQISAEVSRIATALASLSPEPEIVAESLGKRPANGGVNSSVQLVAVQNAIYARRLRDRFFDADLFADPAWDMLLNLFRAEIAQHGMSVSTLTTAAAVPTSTALRWITAMTDADLLRRRADPTDARRILLELTPLASEAMRAYFEELGEPQVISD